MGIAAGFGASGSLGGEAASAAGCDVGTGAVTSTTFGDSAFGMGAARRYTLYVVQDAETMLRRESATIETNVFTVTS
jgi:hypothetical protein